MCSIEAFAAPLNPKNAVADAQNGFKSPKAMLRSAAGPSSLIDPVFFPEFPDPVAPQGPARQEPGATSITGGGLRKKRKAAAAAEAPEEATESFSSLQLF